MNTPKPNYQRDVAVEAERHWWCSKLQALMAAVISGQPGYAAGYTAETAPIVDSLAALIQERTS